MKKKFEIKGISCQSCVAKVEKTLNNLEGIQNVSLNLATSILDLEFDNIPLKNIVKEIEELGYELIDKSKLNSESYDIKGMSCQVCARKIENELNKLEGLIEANVNFASEKLSINFDENLINQAKILNKIKELGYEASIKKEKRSSTLKISGMSCQVCAGKIQKEIEKSKGIISSVVNLASEKGTFEYYPQEIKLSEIKEKIIKLGYDIIKEEETKDQESLRREKENKKELRDLKIALSFTLPLFYLSMGHMVGMPIPNIFDPLYNSVNFALIQLVLTIPVIIAGKGFYTRGFKHLMKKNPNMDSLIAKGTGAALVYSLYATFRIIQGDTEFAMFLYYEVATVIVALVMLGKYMEHISKGKTSEAIKKLSNLRPKKANLVREDKIISVDIEEIELNDILLVKPGESIPCDGIVISGHSLVDESMLTGESIPVEKRPASKLIGASINKQGSMKFRVSATGQDTTLAKIIKLVEDAQGSKAPIARMADVISSYFVPIVMFIATISGLAWYIAGTFGLVNLKESPSIFALSIFIAVLVIACPCSLGLATPTAIMVGTGKGAEMGILIKGGEPLETAHKINAVVFDKTGTITEGKPKLTDILSEGNYTEEELLILAASAEEHSEHPLGEAIASFAKDKNKNLKKVEYFNSLTGMGLEAKIDEKTIYIGNQKLMEKYEIRNFSKENALNLSLQGKTPMYIAINGKYEGLIGVADTIKESSKLAVDQLKKLGIKVLMITGDKLETAKAIGKEAGIEEVLAEVLPEDKSNEIKKLQKEGYVVAMVGDGINDAPALVQSNIGIGIASGTDVAMESADIVLMRNNLQDVPRAIALSKATIKIIKQNLFWAFAYNSLGIPIAAGLFYIFGGPLLDPMIAGAAMAMSSVSVVSNALRLKYFKEDF